MQEPRNSCTETAKTKDSDRRVVPAVANVVMKFVFWNATLDMLADANNKKYRKGLTKDEDDNNKENHAEHRI